MTGPRVLAAVAVLALCCAAPAAAAPSAGGDPVVLVHGWHGAGPDDTLAGSSLATWGQWLVRDGYDVRWASAVAVDPAASMFESADALARHVAAVAADRPGRPVRIVAHSYGAIVARAFLETERYARLRSDGTRVSELVALGAPMGGIDVWLPLLFVLGDPFNEPSVWELMPAAMATFNADHARPEGTRYVVVAGDARRQVPLLWLLPASDGAVTVASAHALAGRTPALSELRTDNVHSVTGYTRLFGWRSLLDDPATYGQVLAAGRSGASDPAAGALALGIPAGRLAAAGGLGHTPVQTAELRPGETRGLVLAAPGAAGYIVGTDESVDLTASPGPAGTEAAAAAGAAAQQSVLGRKAALLAAAPGGLTVQVHNRGTAPARVAWLGLLPPRLRALAVVARAEGGRVTLTPVGPAGFKANTLTVHGREGVRTVETLAGDSALASAATDHRGAGDLLYVQVTGTVGGVPVQSETTLQVPNGPSTD